MAQIPLTEEQLSKARRKGIDLPRNPVVDSDTGDILEGPESVYTPPRRTLPELVVGKLQDWNAEPSGGPIGLVGRSVSEAAIPTAVGGAAGVGTGALLAGLGLSPTTGGASLLIPVIAGLAGYGAAKGQRAITSALARRSPEGMWAKREALISKDVEEHPLLTSALSLPAAKFAGGSVLPSVRNMITNPRQAAKIAAIMSGQDIAIQQLEHPGEFDPSMFGMSVLGGPLFAGKNAPPSSAISELSARLKTLQGRAPETLPITARPNMDIARILSMTPEGLNTIAGRGTGEANFFRVLARLKKSGIELDVNDATKLANEGPGKGYDNVAREIMLEKYPDVDLAKQEAILREGTRQEQLGEALTEQIPGAEERITEVTEQGIRQPPSTGQAEVSAKAMLDAEQKELNKALDKFRESEKTFARLVAQAEQYGEGTPERLMMTKALAQMRAELDAEQVGIFERLRGTPEVPAGVGLSEVEAPRKFTPIKEPKIKPKGPLGRTPVDVESPPPTTPIVPGRLTAPVESKLLTMPGVPPEVPPIGTKPRKIKVPKGVKKETQASEQPPEGESAAKGKIFGGLSGIAELTKRGIFAPFDIMRALIRPTAPIVGGTPLLNRLGKSIEGMGIRHNQLTSPKYQKLFPAAKGLSYDQRVKIGDYLKDIRDSGASNIVLTPEEMAAANVLKELVLETGIEKRDQGPMLNAFGPGGKPIRRPAQLTPNHFPAVKSAEFQELLANSEANPARAEQLRKDYIEHVLRNTNLTPEEAADLYSKQAPAAIGPQAPNARFRAMRYEEGIGLPRSAEEPDPFKAMAQYINRHGLDLGFYQLFESDPVLMKAMGEESYGRDIPLADVVTIPGTGVSVRKGQLAGNERVRQALADYVGFMDKTAQNFERLQSLVHVGRVGSLSQTRNVVQNAGALGEVLTVPEMRFLGTGLFRMFNTTAQNRAMAGGAVRVRRNILPTVAMDIAEGSMRLQDIYAKYTGAEQIARAGDTMLDVIGRAAMKQRILKGDVEFLDYFGPKDWRTKTLGEIEDYIGATFTRHFSGSYEATQLPPALLKGANAQFAPLFKLARWSVGRYNKFYERAILPAKEGHIAPLLRSLAGGMLSAGVINQLVELLTGLKPKELSWEEFLKLGGKDAAYTLFSKAATASNAGLLSDLAFSGIQLSKGEIPRSYNNLVFQLVEDIMTRTMQFGQAVASGNADLSDIAMLGFQSLQDQSQALRLFAPKRDEGNREERIAERLGYLPKGSIGVATLANPISEAGAYRRGDINRVARILESKMEKGQRIAKPPTEIRRTKIRTPEGWKGYYDFIRESQGEEAAKQALLRDQQLTKEKRQMFSSALRRARGE